MPCKTHIAHIAHIARSPDTVTYSKDPGESGGSAGCLCFHPFFSQTEDEGVTGDAGTPAWRHIFPTGLEGFRFFFSGLPKRDRGGLA